MRKLTRPTILTEYAHALGLATDRIQDQWEFIWRHPHFAGGAIWHFMDQGILRTSGRPVDRSKPTQLVWTNPYRYYDTHGLDGSDGVTYADRTPQTDYWQMRKVYAPVRIVQHSVQVKPGRQRLALTVENRYDFRSLQGMQLAWALRRNGRTERKGAVALGAPSRGQQTVGIPVDVRTGAATAARNDVLTLEARIVDEQGVQIGERVVQLELPGAAREKWVAGETAGAAPTVTESAEEIRVELPRWVLAVQRGTGTVSIRDRSGKVLVAGIVPHSGRTPTMAERLSSKSSGLWLMSTLDPAGPPTVSVAQRERDAQVTVAGRWHDPQSPRKAFTGACRLTIAPNGTIAVRYDFETEAQKGMLAEAGLSVVAPPGNGEFRWIGQGPYAGYPGKDQLNEFGIFHLNRADLRFQGNRRGTEVALLTSADGAGVAMALAPGDAAVERKEEQTLLSHNALLGGLGNKGTAPEVTIALAEPLRISGAFALVPLPGQWPAQLVRWFGKPAPARNVYQPFHHSYDQ